MFSTYERVSIQMASSSWRTPLSIRIVADCGELSYQIAEKSKRAITLYFATNSAIIFIHCCAFVLYAFVYSLYKKVIPSINSLFVL